MAWIYLTSEHPLIYTPMTPSLYACLKVLNGILDRHGNEGYYTERCWVQSIYTSVKL